MFTLRNSIYTLIRIFDIQSIFCYEFKYENKRYEDYEEAKLSMKIT